MAPTFQAGGETVRLRLFTPGDSLEELTTFLHACYAEHAAAGRHFFASRQTSMDTGNRIAGAECWLAEAGSTVVGTVTVRVPADMPDGYPATSSSGTFYQLATHPSRLGRGIGSELLAFAEARIVALGGTEVVIDTADDADNLIDWYKRNGYSEKGTWRWSVTNYESLVLTKPPDVLQLQQAARPAAH